MRARLHRHLPALLLAAACAPRSAAQRPAEPPAGSTTPEPAPAAPTASPNPPPEEETRPALEDHDEDAGEGEGEGAWADAGPSQAGATAVLGAPDRLAIARALCETGKVTARASSSSCACPGYTELPADEMILAAIHPGQFSGPGREEAVVATRGCESGASSGQTYGGRALVRRAARGWQRVYYAAGTLGACTGVVSRTGRSLLVCRRIGGHMGAYFDELGLVAFDEAGGQVKEARSPILDVDSMIPDTRGPAYHRDIVRHGVSGGAAFRAGDDHALAVDATVRSRVECVGGADACHGVELGTVDFRLRFVFDGARFRLSPASEDAFRRMNAP